VKVDGGHSPAFLHCPANLLECKLECLATVQSSAGVALDLYFF